MNLVTWNENDKGKKAELSEGNLVAKTSNSSVRATVGKNRGKWYWEISILSGSYQIIGIGNRDDKLDAPDYKSPNARRYGGSNGNKYPESEEYGSKYKSGSVIGIALDMDSGTLGFYNDGVYQGISHNDINNLGEVFPLIASGSGSSPVTSANFGALPFVYEIPEGYQPYNDEYKDIVKISDLTISNRYFNEKETGDIFVKGTVHSSYEDREINELLSVEMTVNNEIVYSKNGMSPFDIQSSIEKESLPVGESIVEFRIVSEEDGRDFTYSYEINRENRDTFTYKRLTVHDPSYESEGDIKFQADKGYALEGPGNGQMIISIPTEGKSNIENIGIDASPDVKVTTVDTYDMEFVSREPLQPMTYFKTSVDLNKITTVKRAELRR